MSSLSDGPGACRLCPRGCGTNRQAGEAGFCRIPGAEALVAHVGLHHGEEPPLSGRAGSGTIFFAGCNLACVFCQNHQISQEFHLASTPAMSTAQLAEAMLGLESAGAHNINFVSPSHMVRPMAAAIHLARDRGLRVPIVYNSNGYDSPAALRQLRGLIDIYLPDLKYQDNDLGRRYSRVRDYAEVALAALDEMLTQVGHLTCDQQGIARQGLLVRHLVLPGALDNSRACLRALACLGKTEITISLMSQYTPQYRASEHPPIHRPLTAAEYEAICDYALDLGLEKVFVQELSSQETYLPDFELDEPFRPSDSH